MQVFYALMCMIIAPKESSTNGSLRSYTGFRTTTFGVLKRLIRVGCLLTMYLYVPNTKNGQYYLGEFVDEASRFTLSKLQITQSYQGSSR